MSRSWPWTATCRSRCASPRERRWSPIRRARNNHEFSIPNSKFLITRFLLLLLLLPGPVRPHLRHTLHVNRGAFALVFAPHRFQEIERLLEVGLNRLPRRGEVQATDFRE